MISKILRLTIASVLALTVVGSAAAHANPADVIRRGNCSGSSDWKLKLSPEDGRIEVEFEVDSNVAGQTWQVRLTKNGNQFFSGSRVTRGASGSFDLRRVTSDPAGDDVIRARATHAGEVCAGSATF
ncbi:MAG: hypothetical protein ACHQY1_07250 [Myxococcota bacterium]|jgi:hypothetical protein